MTSTIVCHGGHDKLVANDEVGATSNLGYAPGTRMMTKMRYPSVGADRRLIAPKPKSGIAFAVRGMDILDIGEWQRCEGALPHVVQVISREYHCYLSAVYPVHIWGNCEPVDLLIRRE